MILNLCRTGLVFLAFLMISTTTVLSQEFKMKYGDISNKNLAMTSYENDTSISAMVIGDFGDIRFIWDQTNGFKIVFKKHMRIKIFTKEGYSYADQVLQLYSHMDSKENVGKIKATTYNIDGKKIVATKMSRKAVFRDEINQYWNSVKFTLPDVREGSIIEFEYTISSNRIFSLPVWYFQKSIPVKWSELTVDAPEYFLYKQLSTGYDPLQISTHTFGSGSISQTTTVRADPYTRTEASSTTNTEKYRTNVYRMVGIDVPPFVVEPMLTTKDNYISKVKFEIAQVNWPNEPPKHYTESWESINRRLMEDSRFGGALEIGLFLNKPLGEITNSIVSPIDRMTAIHEYIKGHMKWDGFYSKYSENLRSAFNKEAGTVADINLMLTLMLKKAGLNASPVILSTRSNGIVNKFFPLMSSLNYVIAMVELDGEFYLLDATDPHSTINMLPARCLNGEGLIVHRERANWLTLNPSKCSDFKNLVSLNMDSSGDFSGTFEGRYSDYAAFDLRDDIDDEKSQDDYIKTIEDESNGLEIVDYEFENLENLYEEVIEKYDVNINGTSDVAGDMIYFNPMFYERMESNLFRIEERKYPIDFGSPMNEVYNLELTIPDGYIVEEMPENMKINLDNDRIVFSYSISDADGVISLCNELHINDILFLYNDYKALRELFNEIVKKHSEMVVLKKVSSSE